MVTSPDMNIAAYVQYAYPLRDYGTLTFLTDYSWIDKVNFSPFTLHTDEAPAYSRVDLRLTWLSAQQNWTVAAFADNVFDDIGIRQIVANGEGANFRRDGALTDPRHYGLEVIYRFGAIK
jgi:iron complex outermembrane receptor protein